MSKLKSSYATIEGLMLKAKETAIKILITLDKNETITLNWASYLDK